jgi:hypothetical protein
MNTLPTIEPIRHGPLIDDTPLIEEPKKKKRKPPSKSVEHLFAELSTRLSVLEDHITRILPSSLKAIDNKFSNVQTVVKKEFIINDDEPVTKDPFANKVKF